jgi:hypothetical protein
LNKEGGQMPPGLLAAIKTTGGKRYDHPRESYQKKTEFARVSRVSAEHFSRL